MLFQIVINIFPYRTHQQITNSIEGYRMVLEPQPHSQKNP